MRRGSAPARACSLHLIEHDSQVAALHHQRVQAPARICHMKPHLSHEAHARGSSASPAPVRLVDNNAIDQPDEALVIHRH